MKLLHKRQTLLIIASNFVFTEINKPNKQKADTVIDLKIVNRIKYTQLGASRLSGFFQITNSSEQLLANIYWNWCFHDLQT